MYATYKPRTKILQQHITEYVVLKKQSTDNLNYFAFPHKSGSLALYFKANINIDAAGVSISEAPTPKPLVITLGKYLEPLLVKYKGEITELSVNFTPVGMNYFFDENFARIANKPAQFLTDVAWNELASRLYQSAGAGAGMIELLEEFLISQFRERDLSKAESAVKLIEADKSVKVKNIALKLNLSERTINRLFHKYIGCSPKDFRKIARFRASIKMNSKDANLTQLCMNNEYYDSSHFCKEFIKLTNKNPKQFFQLLTKTSDVGFPYIFLN